MLNQIAAHSYRDTAKKNGTKANNNTRTKNMILLAMRQYRTVNQQILLIYLVKISYINNIGRRFSLKAMKNTGMEDYC
jgi:hypothetical protein